MPGSAQLGERVHVARHPGVHDGKGIGLELRRGMVVGDDDVGAGVFGAGYLIGVADSAIHRHDKSCPLSG